MPAPTLDDVAFVYFDVDNTLLDHEHAERQALADLREHFPDAFGALSVDALQETYHEINHPLWSQYATGEVDKATVKTQRFARLLDAVDADLDARTVARTYMNCYATHWQFVPGARDAFAAVADRYPVGVLTNGFAEVQAQKLERFPMLRDCSRAVVICEEVGALKPDPRVFEHAASEAETEAARILYVGDSYVSDVEGGQNAGWRVAWYAPDGTDGRSLNGRSFAFAAWSALWDRLA